MGCLFRLIRNILAIIGLITVIIVIILGVCIWQLTKSPALEGKMDKFELTDVRVAQEAAKFDDEVKDLERQLADPDVISGRKKAEGTFTQEMVTAKLIEEIENADIPVDVSDLWVNFVYDEDDERPEVWILGKVDAGLTLTAGLELELVVEDGKPKINMEGDGLGLDVGSGYLPGGIKDQIANAIPTEDALTDMIEDLPIDLDEIEIGDGELTFIGDYKP